ncbi:hypothetical protein CPC735_021590 [Coccidioides posadasii C735 delta SOWgp]|uniref:Cyclase n=1 Tax=Coccidioides posadasii (strain C735) TaxID=222929 RepID=C5PJG1_COCP7|nr:hypothetical protein CPC735_021590 [Coccidioides posadasii C735 delta SOWgp]EER22860.1 hypothetical protein CPC735_021590 [Coccidioides posadasii C735 delta SOWgp]|eukprot:XP_003065005.1 hypothetical protein CPC735_021590 [Coccidioides posadasii C735 delta SOWgp]
MDSSSSAFDIPFDKLPNPKQVWVGKPGSNEEGLGKLALLTPEVVANAAKEIKTGRRVTLGWEMTKLELANLNRHPCQHHIISLLDGVAFDDVYVFNPQQSSQWDGLRHFSQKIPATDDKPAHRVFYGGTTATEILDRSTDRIGMQHWARAGITGRGVLIDYASWAEKHGIEYTTFSTHQIRLGDIIEIAKECDITFQKGDMLFIRIGVTHEWDNVMTDQQKREYSLHPAPEHAGVEATIDMLRWIWDCKFSAVAGDAISWEVSRSISHVPFSLLTRAVNLCKEEKLKSVLGISSTESRAVSARIPARWLGHANR